MNQTTSRPKTELSIRQGCKVIAHYRLSLSDGSVVDASADDEPLQFILGDGTFPPGVEPLFIGLCAGDQARQTVGPSDGWGTPDPNNIQYLDRDAFNDHKELAKGQIVEFRLPNNEALPGTILDINDQRVQVDFNPPLAGRDVTVDVTIIAVEAPE